MQGSALLWPAAAACFKPLGCCVAPPPPPPPPQGTEALPAHDLAVFAPDLAVGPSGPSKDSADSTNTGLSNTAVVHGTFRARALLHEKSSVGDVSKAIYEDLAKTLRNRLTAAEEYVDEAADGAEPVVPAKGNKGAGTVNRHCQHIPTGA